jgi:hypothetical protein
MEHWISLSSNGVFFVETTHTHFTASDAHTNITPITHDRPVLVSYALSSSSASARSYRVWSHESWC